MFKHIALFCLVVMLSACGVGIELDDITIDDDTNTGDPSASSILHVSGTDTDQVGDRFKLSEYSYTGIGSTGVLIAGSKGTGGFFKNIRVNSRDLALRGVIIGVSDNGEEQQLSVQVYNFGKSWSYETADCGTGGIACENITFNPSKRTVTLNKVTVQPSGRGLETGPLVLNGTIAWQEADEKIIALPSSLSIDVVLPSGLNAQVTRIEVGVHGDTSFRQTLEGDARQATFSVPEGDYSVLVKAYIGNNLVAEDLASVKVIAGEAISKKVYLDYIADFLSMDLATSGVFREEGSLLDQAALDFSGIVLANTDGKGNIRVLGEVTHTGSQGDYAFVEITCEFFDDKQAFVGAENTYIAGSCLKLDVISYSTRTNLTPGEKGAWKLTTNIPWSAVANFNCRVSFIQAALSPPRAELSVSDALVSATEDGRWRLTGSATNTGTLPVGLGALYSVIRDADDAVIDVATGIVRDVPVGGLADFTINSYVSFNDVARHDLSACSIGEELGESAKPVAGFAHKPGYLAVNEGRLFNQQHNKLFEGLLHRLR